MQARSVAAAVNAEAGAGILPHQTFLSLCMPAYNEEANIEHTLESACAILPEFVQRFEIVIANDGSRDGTAGAVARYGLRDPRVRLVNLEQNLGYGGALSSALRAARGDLVAFTDSDGQFSMLDLPNLLSHVHSCDVVVGYRYPRADPWYRSLNAFAWNRLVRILFGVKVRDLDCAFKLFRREVLEEIEMTSNGAAINAQILAQVFQKRLRIREVPVGHYPRYHGAPTGARFKVILKAFRELPQLWKYRSRPACQQTRELPTVLGSRPACANGTSHGSWSRGPAGRMERVNGSGKILAETNGHRSALKSRPGLLPAPRGHAAPAHPLKVCMLAACPFPANHGTPGSIREMSEALVEIGHEVHVVTYHIGEDIPVCGPRIHRIPRFTSESSVVVGPTLRRPLYDLLMVYTALKVIRRYRIDLIHAQGYEATLAAWLCRLVTGVPIIYSGHNIMAPDLPGYGFIRPAWLARGLGRLLDVAIPRLADRLVPHSGGLARFFAESGLGAHSEPIVNFGIDLSRIPHGDQAALRRKYDLGDAPVVLYAGVLDEFQRLDLLLGAMVGVVGTQPGAKLLVVQTIPNERHVAELRRAARELGLESAVVITEPQPLEAARELLAVADVAVAPRPQTPGFSIKLLNYMAARKPCVLFASSASEGLSQENAILAMPDSPQALADGILKVLGDPSLSHRLAKNGFTFVKANHDRRVVAERIVQAYLRALSSLGRAVLPARREIAAEVPDDLRLSAPVDILRPNQVRSASPANAPWFFNIATANLSDRFRLEALCELGA
jgi:glycosyltransferase involved in cell wall biosynthesis